MKALNDYVIIEPINKMEELNKSLSHLEVKANEGEPNKGVIRAIGPDVDIDVTIGNTIIFDEVHPRGFKHEGKDYLFVKKEFVIAMIGADK